jgi:hypothetical protein
MQRDSKRCRIFVFSCGISETSSVKGYGLSASSNSRSHDKVSSGSFEELSVMAWPP